MHSIINTVRQLRTWGLRGVFNYLVRAIHCQRLNRFFRSNARQYPVTPEFGVTLIADLTGTGSLSKVMRDLAFRLKDAEIPFQTFNLHEGNITIPEEDYHSILTPRSEFRILKYSHALEMCTRILPPQIPVKRSRIYFWEFSSGLLEYDASLAMDGEVVAMSDFNRNVFRECLPKNVCVKKILYPFIFNVADISSPAEIRAKYGFKPDDFIVFFNFDFGTSYKRKNPEDALRAFAGAFASEPGAHFLFKAKNAKQHPEELSALKALAAELGVGDRVRVVTDYLSQRELYGLTNACDVYLSLHRGEGFGLGIAEAMSLGKPVIVTDYSSTTEFCNAENSIPIPYTMVDVKPGDIDNPCYHSVKSWAQPDIKAAATALRKLFDDTSLRTKLGDSARAYISSYFSTDNFRNSVSEFLNS